MTRYKVLGIHGCEFVEADHFDFEDEMVCFHEKDGSAVAAFRSWMSVVIDDEKADEEEEECELVGEKSIDEFVNQQINKFIKGFKKKRNCCGEGN